MMTEEDDMMTEECLMREEATEGGQGHIAQGVLAELGAGHEVQETEDDQGHGVGQDLGLDLGRLVNLGQGQDLEKEKYTANSSQIAGDPPQHLIMESMTQHLLFQL